MTDFQMVRLEPPSVYPVFQRKPPIDHSRRPRDKPHDRKTPQRSKSIINLDVIELLTKPMDQNISSQ